MNPLAQIPRILLHLHERVARAVRQSPFVNFGQQRVPLQAHQHLVAEAALDAPHRRVHFVEKQKLIAIGVEHLFERKIHLFEHFERLSCEGSRPGVILVANHPSLIDYVLIASRLEHINCVVKEALRHNLFLKGIVKATGYLANDDPEAFLQHGSACLAQGEDLLIFPEGTRTSRQREFRLRRGAAALAVHSGRPLQVITITLSTEFLSKEKRWYHVPRTCPEYVLSVGEKLSPGELSEPSLSDMPASNAEGLPEGRSGGLPNNSAMDGATPQAQGADCGPDNEAEPEAISLRTRRLNRRLTEILKHANNGSFKYGT